MNPGLLGACRGPQLALVLKDSPGPHKPGQTAPRQAFVLVLPDLEHLNTCFRLAACLRVGTLIKYLQPCRQVGKEATSQDKPPGSVSLGKKKI